jgi:hypothetical protein
LAPAPLCAQADVPVEVLFTGKSMGYLRLPDEQSGRSVVAGCPASDQDASAEAKHFLRAYKDLRKGNTVLVGMGDNFAPELFSRIFRVAPELPNDGKKQVRLGLYGKDQFVWDWDLATPRWVFASDASETVQSAIEKGGGRIPTDNVGCFLAAAGYDAIVPGKHDFYFGPERLRYLARFLATPRDSSRPVQLLATNLVIRTSYAPSRKTLSDYERGVDYATSDEKLEPVDLGGGNLLPWVRRLRFKAAAREPLEACLYSTVVGDPSKRKSCDHRLEPKWSKEPPPNEPHHFDLRIPDGAMLPGRSYAVCLRRPPQAMPSTKTPSSSRDYCVRVTVDHPFFLYPNACPTPANPRQPYSDPLPYVWRCLPDAEGRAPLSSDVAKGECTPGHAEVAIFGVVDPELKEHIGQLNYSWLNATPRSKYKTEIEVTDPADALRQVRQLFDTEHPRFRGVKVLLAQMIKPRAQHLAAKLGGEFHVVIAEPQVEHVTGNASLTLHGPPPRPPADKLPPTVVVVPPPFYDPIAGKPAVWPRKLVVNRLSDAKESSRFSFELDGEPAEVPQSAERVEDQLWLRKAIVAAWNRLVPEKEHLGPDAPREKFRSAFQDYVLHVLKQTARADVALLQKRDFFFGARLTPREVTDRDVTLAIDRILWKGDVVIKRTLPGKSLKEVLKRSKSFDERDDSLLSLDVEKRRGLVKLGIAHDAARDQYLVNGEPLDDGRLYTVATSDYAGLGDTGYPELISDAAGGPLLPRDFKYVCPLHLVVDLARQTSGEDYDDPRCGEALTGEAYFDHLEGTPPDTRTDSYGRRLAVWLHPKRRHEDPWPKLTALETKSQLRPEWFFSLSKTTLAFNAIRNNVTEAERQDDFKGVTVPQVQSAKSSFVSVANQVNAGRSWSTVDLFGSYDLAHTRTGTGQKEAPRLLNYAENRLVFELGAFLHFKKRKFPRFGPQMTFRIETQLFRPRENIGLSDVEKTNLILRYSRTWNYQVPRVGLRVQGRDSQFQAGITLSSVQRVEAFVFQDPTTGLTQTCMLDPRAEGFVPECVKTRSDPTQPTPPTITRNSQVSAELSRVKRRGWYATAKLVLPSGAKVSYVSEHDFELLWPNEESDLPSMMYWRYLMTHGVRFKIFDNFTLTPKLETFFFKNQSGPNPNDQHFFRQLKWTADLNYSFDWFRGNPGRVTRYKKPDK